jgi:hypothetical protein
MDYYRLEVVLEVLEQGSRSSDLAVSEPMSREDRLPFLQPLFTKVYLVGRFGRSQWPDSKFAFIKDFGKSKNDAIDRFRLGGEIADLDPSY